MRTLPLVALALVGCLKGAKVPDLSSYTPQVTFQRLDLGAADWSGVDARFILNVRNRSPISLNVAKWSWALALADTPFLSGDVPTATALEARATRPVAIPVRLVFADLIRTAEATRGQDAVPYGLSGDLTVQTPLGPVTVPYRHAGSLPALRAPKIQVQALRVQSLDLLKGRAELALDLALQGEGGGRMILEAAKWTLGLGGVQVADGATEVLGAVSSGDTTPVTLPIGINLARLGAATVSALQKKDPVDVRFGADLSVATPLGRIPLKVDEAGRIPVR
jgi:hypothetical protein